MKQRIALVPCLIPSTSFQPFASLFKQQQKHQDGKMNSLSSRILDSSVEYIGEHLQEAVRSALRETHFRMPSALTATPNSDHEE